MNEYIKRSELLKLFTVAPDGTRYKEVDCDNFPVTVQLKTIKKMICEAPAADVRPVAYGVWKKAETPGLYKCSNCGRYVTNNEVIDWDYCNCGADMRHRKSKNSRQS